jgi:4-hydroxybenzoate polyprenyltransferase/phosphoserine phosphatase
MRSNEHIPLCVDLDGTLLDSDLLLESGLAYVRDNPLSFLALVVWLATSGKAGLKSRIANEVELDVTTLPYNETVLEFVRTEKSRGRRIVLATASHVSYARKIADHLQVFDQVLGTDEVNLSAHRKAERLVTEFGDKGFDYMGNASADLPIWKHARQAYVVNARKGVVANAIGHGNVEGVFDTRDGQLTVFLRAMRFHQWMKNLLVFAPLLAAHQFANVDLLSRGLLTFVVFGLCASSVYILNDLIDLQDDRHHPTKRNRPFAAGSLSISAGLLAAPILLGLAFGAALWLLPWQFTATLACYYLLTLAYSLVLKRLMMVDVIVLGILYTLRIVGGTFALGLSLTFWLLAFSMFIFLSLALVKRYAELVDARRKGEPAKARGRGYFPSDLEMLSSLGGASGYLAVMVLALYIQDSKTIAMYSHPEFIWMSCPLLLFWISRTWMITHRGEMHDDPVVFAIKDKVSILVGVLFGLTFWIAR